MLHAAFARVNLLETLTMADEKREVGGAFRAFREAIAALRVFSQEIGRHANEHDRRALTDFANEFSSLFGVDLDDPLDSQESEHFGEEAAALEDMSEDGDDPTDDLMRARIDEVFRDPARQQAFDEAISRLRKRSPRQGEILRRGALITLMSHFEALIADLIHSYYSLYPVALPAETRTMTLAELRDAGSIDAAEQYLVGKEVDSVLRESLDWQLEYLTKRPKVKIDPLGTYIPLLLELDQRRNLYVHNKGIVNRLYLQHVSADLIARYKLQAGEEIRSTDEYLSDALDTVFVVGTVLTQLCWRAWNKNDLDDCDRAAIETLYDALVEEQWSIVERVASFLATTKMASDENRRVVIVNHAIALRDSGRPDEMEALLDTYDWSACSLIYRLAFAALRKDHAETWKLVERAAAAEEIDREQIESWPLFRSLRSSTEYAERIARVAFRSSAQPPSVLPPEGASNAAK